jgi:hypothetical protein
MSISLYFPSTLSPTAATHIPHAANFPLLERGLEEDLFDDESLKKMVMCAANTLHSPAPFTSKTGTKFEFASQVTCCRF